MAIGVLHRVVQERGGEGRRVEAQVGQDLGDRHRMLDERPRPTAAPAPRARPRRRGTPARAAGRRPSGCRSGPSSAAPSRPLGAGVSGAAQARAGQARRRGAAAVRRGPLRGCPSAAYVYAAPSRGVPHAAAVRSVVDQREDVVPAELVASLRGTRARSGRRCRRPCPPIRSTSEAAAFAVPPVASTSSTIRTRSPGLRRRRAWISSEAVPYSSV